ncbi:MAG: hypothetical protein L0Y44_00355 [Phycisphaerales bacterium]|nr:hypothetical protein [Phycisphaerales bacterium]MCI0629088.1 hypothetical protein [Phycisphaerales bacterium]MCI0674394.1 hypothetical protein [Phycisphaerales bacterium]
MRPATLPLFKLDPGWLFIVAGLAICVAGILLPAHGDLEALEHQLAQLHIEEEYANARLRAHADFMDQVDRADPALVRRLAAAQLNLVPAGDTPILLAATESSPVTDWIDATVDRDIRPQKPVATSMLSRLANGPHRLWLFGGGIMSVFIGLMLSPGASRPSRMQSLPAPATASALVHAQLREDRESLIEHLDAGAQAPEFEFAQTESALDTDDPACEVDISRSEEPDVAIENHPIIEPKVISLCAPSEADPICSLASEDSASELLPDSAVAALPPDTVEETGNESRNSEIADTQERS